jgi:hypothetical protein
MSARKTRSALVDQSYQSPVIQDKKGVQNCAFSQAQQQFLFGFLPTLMLVPAFAVLSWDGRNVSKQGSINRKQPWNSP